ncbi:MAG: PQQ-dependent sugar dehydrogenase [Gammaproteobacteria bacterium]
MFSAIKTRNLTVLAAAALLIACTDNAATQQAQAPRSPTPEPVEAPVKTSVVAEGLEHPWGLEFLPDGRMLVTERPGRLRIVANDGTLSEPLAGVPEVYTSSQGGLLDVALSPDFEADRLVYLSYSEPDGDVAGTAVARGTLGRQGLRNMEVIWRQTPKTRSANHWGSRIVFRPDGTLFVTTGDRYKLREEAQDLSTTIGKVIRINADGSIPQDNPFVDQKGAKPEIWSYGHRNVQGAALHPRTDQLWTLEHGAMGGDELNHPQPGRNYGWPVITYGVDYSGAKIGEGVAKEGMEQPVYFWDPVIAPSGALFYTGDAFPAWQGDLFVGSLDREVVVRLDMQDGRVASETRFLAGLGQRIRDVRQGPDGAIYLITDEPDGQIIKVEPAG